MEMSKVEKALHTTAFLALVCLNVCLALLAGWDLVCYTGCLFIPQIFILVVRLDKFARNNHRFDSLEDPLITRSSQTVLRDNAACRTAQEGFNRCKFCGFENFKHSKTCAICIAPIPGTCSDQPEKLSQSQSPTLTPRQQRARRRNEWQRKLDVHGRIFWYRDNIVGRTTPTIPDSGWTIVPAAPAQPEREPEIHEKDLMDAANDSKSAPVFHLIESTQANAAQFPNGKIIDSATVGQTLQIRSTDFPSRYSHFVSKTSSEMCPATVEFLRLTVHRSYVLEESLAQLGCVEPRHLHSIFRINFVGEDGVDGGGLQREWFMLLNDKLMEPCVGLFRCTNARDQSYYLNPNSLLENGEDHLTYYRAVGRLVGRALLEGSVLNFHFAVPLLKMILGIPVAFSDLEYLDDEAYHGLVWLLENEQVEDLGLTFSVCELVQDRDGGSHVVVVDLIANGREVDVTDANKREFVQRKFEYLVFGSVCGQLEMFLRGIYEIIPLELLMLFDHEELDYILCGDEELDVEEWKKHTYVSPSLRGSWTLRWFWEIVEEMPMEYRSRLLQFATGSSRLPASGFEGLTSYDGRMCPFTLFGVTLENPRTRAYHVHGHACFNRIDLPLFEKRRDLERVLYAILDTESYGFTEL